MIDLTVLEVAAYRIGRRNGAVGGLRVDQTSRIAQRNPGVVVRLGCSQIHVDKGEIPPKARLAFRLGNRKAS